MKVRYSKTLITVAALLAIIVTAIPASAQKMKTDIPPEITTPDSVETRLGTLKFHDGFPDDATVQRSMTISISSAECKRFSPPRPVPIWWLCAALYGNSVQ